MRIYRIQKYQFSAASFIILMILIAVSILLDEAKEFFRIIYDAFGGAIHYIAHCLMIASQDLIYPASAIVILSFAILYVPFLSKLKPFVIHTMMLPVFFSVALVGIVSCYFGI